MRKLQADGKIQNLPALCTPGSVVPQRKPPKRSIGA
jgi:hypothetical protein